MRRRQFIAGLAGSVAWPIAALAQPAGQLINRDALQLPATFPDSLRFGDERHERHPARTFAVARIKCDHPAGTFLSCEVDIFPMRAKRISLVAAFGQRNRFARGDNENGIFKREGGGDSRAAFGQKALAGFVHQVRANVCNEVPSRKGVSMSGRKDVNMPEPRGRKHYWERGRPARIR